MWRTERILITVKTYPTPSKAHQETVCTAGVTEDGRWLRLYPIPFRDLPREKQYSKFDWIEARVDRARRDGRPESHNVDCDSLRIVGSLDTRNWDERRRLVETGLADSVEALEADRLTSRRSLGVVRPHNVKLKVTADPQPYWTPEELAKLRASRQDMLPEFTEPSGKRTLEKVPFQFSYQFIDQDPGCRSHTMRILDWEVYALARKYGRDLNVVDRAVRGRYYDDFVIERDLHLLLGTLLTHPQTWTIVGVFAPPRKPQMALDFGK